MSDVEGTAAPIPTGPEVKTALGKAIGSALSAQQAIRDHADKLAAERAPAPEPAPEGT